MFGLGGFGLNNIFEKIDSTVDEALESVGIGKKAELNPYMKKARQVARQFMTTAWKQGWQWSITTSDKSAPANIDMYVKDIDYGDGSVDVDVKQIGSGSIALPTFSNAGEVTMTVRDDELNTVSDWISSRVAKVRNKNGTVNLPIDYVMTLYVHSLDGDGNVISTKPIQGYFIKMGNKNHTKEGGNTIESYPVIFQKFSTVDFEVPNVDG